MNILFTCLFALASCLVGYLFGSIPTGVIIGRLHGIDIRSYGSHNTGGTNVGRTLGKKAGILTIVLDMFKAYIPLCLILLLLSFTPLRQSLISYKYIDELFLSLCGFSVLLGHTFPLFAHFKGGKAVSCIAGYIFFISPILFLIGISLFLILFSIFKKISLCSIITTPSVFLLTFVPCILDLTVLKDIHSFNGGQYITSAFMVHPSYLTVITCFFGVLLVIIRHKANIKRLREGKEPITHFSNTIEK